MIVQMEGTISWLGEEETHRLLDDMCARFEAPGGYSLNWVDDARVAAMLREIVGFQIHVQEMQPKLKLSQNRSLEDRSLVQSHFAQAPSPGPELADWMSGTKR
ncbi:hypothetical protein AKJ08_1180 [Vulgatibacter incomptus]|uniref:Uncharacterized protein n=1 Tax=Vulgatibacter incomptus TaxID=1391653 RepID=A0A0K1PB83_9BACT|nr:hypothetical protein AKJ08_1180 [Vulgatibacter incomptus]